MSIAPSSLERIVLVGGGGSATKKFMHERIGADVPEELCAIVGQAWCRTAPREGRAY